MSNPTFIAEDLTFRVEADCPLIALSQACAAVGQSAPFDASETSEGSVGRWIEGGMKGAPSAFADPVAQTLVGLEGTLHDGTHISLRPCPRRAAGPDLRALFVGQEGRFGRVTAAWIYVGPRKAASVTPYVQPPSTARSAVERDILARLANELSSVVSSHSAKESS